MATRNRNSARGAQIDCVNFEMCPLCYGCRAFDTLDPRCAECLAHPKRDICNTKSHKAHLVARMITKTQVYTKGDL